MSDFVNDLKEAKKEIENLILTFQRIEHKTEQFQDMLRQAGLTEKQMSVIQDWLDEK